MVLKVAVVTWVDVRASTTPWIAYDDIEGIYKDDFLGTVSVGFIGYEDDDQIVLVQSHNIAGHVSDTIQIPKVSIKSINILGAA